MALTAGTMIATPRGERPVESLAIGDRVITRTGGFGRIRRLTRRRYLGPHLALAPHLNPVRIEPDAFGAGWPDRGLAVSRAQTVTVPRGPGPGWWSAVTLAVRTCTGMRGIRTAEVVAVTYFDVELDRADSVLANGLWLDIGPIAAEERDEAATARMPKPAIPAVSATAQARAVRRTRAKLRVV